jgi:hypothetical protein
MFELFFENLSREFKFRSNPSRITDALQEEVLTFMTISGRILLRMRNVLDKICRQNKKKHFMFNKIFFFSKIVPFRRQSRKIWWGHGATKDVTIRRIRFACWISKATRLHAHAHAYAPGHKYKGARAPTHEYIIQGGSNMTGTNCDILHTISPGHIWTTLYLCLLYGNNNSRKRLNVILYSHCRLFSLTSA